ncbi:bifunctional (p)ppGpp synthetase/guanosine-3',5'-bis(diphosphate) 3'-pyrophosphohydrolase, partial [candidate division WWE3 bacterium]|nr:bifunctional (p)ppGpp synthetase/guanosine-3',5'-bis(diphosphate) 3'-pyrophosphohydrolase [candidate division WWE3 bacterium]
MKKQIIENLKKYNFDLDLEKIEDVFDFVQKKYEEIGDEFISPLEMIEIAANFRPDTNTVIAIFLHHLHDHGIVKESQIRKKFGEEVLGILRGVKKLEDLDYVVNDKNAKVEVLRMMFLAMITDLRVVLVLLSCRLYKMKCLHKIMDKKEANLFARETLDLYVPVSARLGIYGIKGQLEDLAFAYSNPEDYADLNSQVEEVRQSCNLSITYIQERLKDFFEERGVEVEVVGRIKNIYSIYKKLQKKGLTSAKDLYDIFAMRIVVPAKIDKDGVHDLDNLYGILGLIHSEWKPLSRRFKDYIAVPKPNGYKSLHTCVLGLGPKEEDQPIEIQIRDRVMHEDAEYGVAAHWRYKHGGKSQVVTAQADWIKGLEQFSSDFDSDIDRDAAKEVGADVLADRIFVLTPRGEVKDLPAGANAIDFAYSVHTDVGHRCVMAKINSVVVPLNQELANGDVVEVITQKDSKPKLQWLSVAKTSLARNKIRAWFGSLNKDKNIKEGRAHINSQLERIGQPILDNKYSILKKYLDRNLNLSDRESLVEEVGKGSKIAADVIRKVFPYKLTVVDKVVSSKKGVKESEKVLKNESLKDNILVGGEDGLPIKMAACCKPSLGDNILGYVTRGNHVTVHKVTCSHIDKLDTDRIVFADWKGRNGSEKYLVGIRVEAVTRVGLMSDVTAVISSLGVHIREVSIKDQKGDKSYEYFLVELEDLSMFDRLVDKIESVRGVE